MGRADVYLQPEAKDPVLSHLSVLKIAATHTDRGGAVLEVDESGGEARAYLLEGDVVVKTQRPHRLRPRTSLAKEAALLDYIAASLGGHVPHLFGRGHTVVPEGEVEYLVMSRMPGRAVRHLTMTGETRATLLRATGALIARLHAACDTAALVAGGHFPQDHDGADLVRRLESGFADVTEEIAKQPGCWTLPITPEHAAARALALIPAGLTPVALHSNPGPTHVFADDEGTLTGVIDFGDAYVSHPAMACVPGPTLPTGSSCAPATSTGGNRRPGSMRPGPLR
jgi:Ser/Thr protein kinase RdoA (MazF antagonist)